MSVPTMGSGTEALYHWVNQLARTHASSDESKQTFANAMWEFSQGSDGYYKHKPKCVPQDLGTSFSVGWFANRAKLAGVSEQKIRALAVMILT